MVQTILITLMIISIINRITYLKHGRPGMVRLYILHPDPLHVRTAKNANDTTFGN